MNVMTERSLPPLCMGTEGYFVVVVVAGAVVVVVGGAEVVVVAGSVVVGSGSVVVAGSVVVGSGSVVVDDVVDVERADVEGTAYVEGRGAPVELGADGTVVVPTEVVWRAGARGEPRPATARTTARAATPAASTPIRMLRHPKALAEGRRWWVRA